MGSAVRSTVDVVVLGAGPAGCVFATRMVQLGFDVCLIERSRFPRPRLGESLSPGVMPMLASMGAASRIDPARVSPVRTVAVHWDATETTRDDPRAQGVLVDRGVFDLALLGHARDIGVHVLQPAVMLQSTEMPDGWHISVDAPSGRIEIRTAFLADATGRSARLGGKRLVMGPRTIAVHGYWTGANVPRHPRIEAGAREWYWGVPIPDGSYNTLVFVDGDRFRAEPHRSLSDRLRSLLDRSALGDDVRGARLRAPARAADATPYVDDACVSARHIRLGDAGLALDPLSSSGVQKAIQTALSGAIVTNTLLRRRDAGEAARCYYHDNLHRAAVRHRAWARAHYATAAATRDDPFWTDRAVPGNGSALPGTSMDAPVVAVADDVPLALSPDARWEELPCLGPQFVEMRPALRHPRLEAPVAYVGGHELAPLLRDVRPGTTSRELAHAWSTTVSPRVGLSIARWLSGHGVLEPADSSGSHAG